MKRAEQPERRRPPLEVRAFYSVAELARAANVRPYTLLRLLRRNGVTFMRSGRAFYVTLDEVRRKIAPLWDSLRLSASQLGGDERVRARAQSDEMATRQGTS